MDLQTLIRSTLNEDSVLKITESLFDVYQADTPESPTQKPFIVVRWLDVQDGIGRVKRRPVTLWVYDDEGDYSRAKRIAQRAADVLLSLDSQQLTESGWLLQFEDGNMGAELADDGWKAVVVPYDLTAIASGL